ncbi:hypothetical protein CAPI_05650 [Corynebacterium capitovis DSM 44611]|uniref:helix-turn-helix transcriptional regulator n=1 Tax=Corynebacterium capitovis TaxID=131081 RepID=UPI0003800BF4|nr:WYL domain-containing protein [Corynebacterium capitovis]WKD57680.1 hypothetical protein CAPI_05650 [Corynebacterium capitovis DSM 44611]
MNTRPAGEDAAIRRLTNLTFALLGSPRPRDFAWIQAHVEGYEGRGPGALQRQIARDVKTIRRAGVPARADGGLVWVDKDAYELPAIAFTDEEATVLGLAGELGQGTSLGAFARSGWVKLAASGVTRSFDSPALASADNDVLRLDATVVRDVTACVRGQERMVFDYAPAAGAPTQTRVMDPWGIVALNNRAYVVGFDPEREQVRVFRAKRVTNVRRAGYSGPFHQPNRPLAEIVRETLRGPVTDARLTLARVDAELGELSERGRREGSEVVFTSVERDWLVRTVASVATDIAAIEPKDVRDDVVTLLSHARGTSEGVN